MDGLEWVAQDSFAQGAFPLQERVPGGAVEDLVNGLLDDDGSVFKRGGAIYKTPAAIAITPLMIWDGGLGGGQRTLLGNASSIYMLDAGDTTVSVVSVSGGTPVAANRPVVVGGLAFWPAVSSGGFNGWIMAGGSRQPADYSGTATVATGAQKVTASASAARAANALAGAVFVSGSYAVPARAFPDDVTVMLAAPWPGPSLAGAAFSASRSYGVYHEELTSDSSFPIYLAAGANRLWWLNGNMIRFTDALKLAEVTGALSNYHELPDGVVARGAMAVGGTMMVFTNGGAWAVRNIAYDLTDALGNPQQQLELAYPEMRLWHINGVVQWKGALVVPANDDVYLVDGVSAPIPMGRDARGNPAGSGIRKLYRTYAAAGYTLGAASIIAGHYVLPILNGTTWVDTLMCKLSSGAWSRMAGASGASIGFATRVSANAVESLLSVKSTRILDCTGWLWPVAGNKLDADGTTPQLQVTLRTVQRRTPKELLMRFRVRCELDDAATDNPTLTAEVAVGRPGSAFTALTGSMAENDGQSPHTWSKIGKRGTEFRVRLTSVGASAKLVLRSVEYAFRPSGRQ